MKTDEDKYISLKKLQQSRPILVPFSDHQITAAELARSRRSDNGEMCEE